jgi:micrococcal nuclease
VSKKKLNLLITSFVFLFVLILNKIQYSGEYVNAPAVTPQIKAEASPAVLSATNAPTATSSSQFTVTKIIDGDTIQVNGILKVRYIGIDTPETVDPKRGVGCFGKEASAKNSELVLGKIITMEKDVNETDRFGRLLRYVYINGVMINNELVRLGYAKAATFPPDVKYQSQFSESEKYARENKLGLWGNCF